MEQKFSPYSLMAGIAERSIQNQERRPGDFINDEGFLTCGKCGKPRQMKIPFLDPTEEDPEHQTKLLVTVMCDCEKAEEERLEREKRAAEDMEKISRLRKASLMDERFSDSVFENFQVTEANARNLKLCKRYAEHFDEMMENNQGLLFWGNVGTGKSFAAACIANYLIAQKVPVIMTSFVKLLEVIQNGGEKETEIVARLNRAKLVIFDDLGAERNTGYALEKVYNIIDSRYRKKLPMILTTNLSITEMKNEGDIRYNRIYDRVFESCYPMQFTGRSWRRKEAARRFTDMEKLLEGD